MVLDLKVLQTKKCANCKYGHQEEGCLLVNSSCDCIQNGYIFFVPRFKDFNIDEVCCSESYFRREK